MDAYNDEVNVLVHVKTLLEGLLQNNKNESIEKIYNDISTYLESSCKHSIVNDLIDITPNLSKEIQYCEYCFKTFSLSN